MKIHPTFVIAALLVPLLIPPVVYLAVAVAAGLGPSESVDALVGQIEDGSPSPLVAGFLGLFPALILLAVAFALRKLKPEAKWIRPAGWGGLGALAVVLIWANLEAWPAFLPGRTFPGWPHGLELVIAPLFFGPVAVVVGMLAVGSIAGAKR